MVLKRRTQFSSFNKDYIELRQECGKIWYLIGNLAPSERTETNKCDTEKHCNPRLIDL